MTLSNYNRANDVCVRVCGNRLLERPISPKSQVMFVSAFSWIGDFFVFLAFILFTLWSLCWIYEYACNEHVAHWCKRRWLWGRTLHTWCHNNVGGVTVGQVWHNSSILWLQCIVVTESTYMIYYFPKVLFHGPIRSGVMISRQCRTSYQSSPFIAISCVPRYSLQHFH